MIHSFVKHSTFTLRGFGWTVLAATLFFSLLLLFLRYWLLPDIERYRTDIAAAISEVAGQAISIERINANWDGLHPYLQLHGVRVHDKHGMPVLILKELDGSLSWRSLLYGELLFHGIKIERPALIIRRDTEGAIHIAGGTFDQEEADNGFLDWLLRQRQLIINDADVYWLDEPRAAPVLYLKQVGLRMHNKNGRHRFGLRLTPPAEVADPIDIRGDFSGESVNALGQWRGRLFAQLDQVDLVAMQTWLSFPEKLEFDRGKGAFRAWLGMEGESVAHWTVDMNFHEVHMDWAKDLPELDLVHLRGRIGWKREDYAKQQGEEWFAQQLSIAFKNKLVSKPVNILWQRHGLSGNASEQNTLRIEDLDFGVVTSLRDYLPMESALQKQINDLTVNGVIEHANIYWRGNWAAPLSFRAEASFRDLASKELGKLPAVSGFSGSVNVTERGGTLSLDSDKISIESFGVMDEPLKLDRLIAQLSWKTSPDQDRTQFEFEHISFANSQVSGTMHGRYLAIPEKVGSIDLAGELAHAEVAYLSRYLALVTDRVAGQGWPGKAIAAGQLKKAKFLIQGDVNESSSNPGSKLAVQLATKITGTTINLPEGWPSMKNIQADLSLQNNQLEIMISQANLSDLVVKDTRLQITDVHAPNPILQLTGGIEGTTQKIMNLIEKGPLKVPVADFSLPSHVSGQGQLRLELAMPIASPGNVNKHVEFKGRYQFIDNEIVLGHDLPALSKVNGQLAFSQSTLTIDQMSAQLTGEPVKIKAGASPNGGLRLVATGRVNLDRLHPVKPEQPASTVQLWLQLMQGVTDWSAVLDLNEKGMEVKVESTLTGAASLLPQPFSKSAAEMIPVSFVRKSIDSEHELLRFRYGGVATVEIERARGENGIYFPVRGMMNFSAASALPKDTVTLVHGTISALEWDRWKALFDRHDEIGARTGQAGRGIKALLTERVNFNLSIGRLDFLGRRFNQFSMDANKYRGQWHTSVTSKEVIGDIDWDSDKKKAFARLKKLIMPEAIPETASVLQKKNIPKDWPIMDLLADEFFVGEKSLGKLQLMAHQQKDGWHIDKLQIAHADSFLLVKGLWQNRIAPFQMQAEVNLQANSIGKFLARLGYPGRVARGEGELSGSLGWTGEPFSVDFSSLSGNLRVTAQRGQFTRFKPGVSKLLGIFDLKSIPRRLTLDFYDVFSKGFGFDHILGDVRITNGMAVTDELQITGSAAYLVVSGEIDLVEETQELLVKMFPSLGLVTPVVGIASMIANQSLKDPFDRILFNEYAITGTWNNPLVAKSQSSQQINESRPDHRSNEN